MRSFRLAVVTTHPIQYQIPFWRTIARDRNFELKVFFTCRQGLEEARDPGFEVSFRWDVPLLSGYEHDFRTSWRIPLLHGPSGNRWPRRLTAAFRSGGFDAVMVHGYALPTAWAGLLAAWRSGVRIIMRGESHDRSPRTFGRAALKRFLLPWLLRRIDGFLAIGTWNREYWLSLGVPEERIRTAVYSVDSGFFRRRLDEGPDRPEALRSQWGAAEGHVVFLFVGKFIAAKDPLLLLEAYAQLPSRDRVHLVWAGAGPLEPALRRRVRQLGLGNVHWAGFVNQQDLPFYYRASDVLVLPSRFEPWGLVVNEAMACLTPCIVSDAVGASADLVKNDVSGRVFNYGNAGELCHALSEALDPGRRSKWREGIPAALDTAGFERNTIALRELLETVFEPGMGSRPDAA